MSCSFDLFSDGWLQLSWILCLHGYHRKALFAIVCHTGAVLVFHIKSACTLLKVESD